MLRLLAIVAAFSTLLALTGLLELIHCEGDHGNGAGEPAACVCICHASVAVLPEVPILPLFLVQTRMIERMVDMRRPQDAPIAIDPPPDKRAG